MGNVEWEQNQNVVTVEENTVQLSGDVRFLKKEVKVQQIRLKEKVSYAEAVKLSGKDKPKEGRGNMEQRKVKEQQDKKNAWEEKKKTGHIHCSNKCYI